MNINLIKLNNFIIFGEFFMGIVILYLLIIFILLLNNFYDILVQKIISEYIGIIFLLTLYVFINEKYFFLIDFYSFISVNFQKSMFFDYLAFFAKFTITFFCFLFFIVISDYLKSYQLTASEFLILLLFIVLGLLFLCSSNDLLLSFLAIELISLPSYLIASFKKNSNYSIESGLKYFVIGTISSILFLFSCSFFYLYLGSTLFSDFYLLINYIKYLSLHIFLFNHKYSLLTFNPFVEIGLLFLVFSVFIKLALAPFHIWSLDVYESAPVISTFFFTVITKLSFFVFLFRIYAFLLIYYNILLNFYCVLIGFTSIFIGSVGNLTQKKIKTIFAYSSVSHMGYVLLAFSSGLLIGFEMAFFYLIIYMLSNINIWYIILTLQKKSNNYKTKISKNLSDLSLLNKSNKFLSLSLTIILFSIAGIPPLIGFFAKINVFFALISKQFYIASLLTLLCSVISTFYYIRIIKVLVFENLVINILYYPINSYSILILCFCLVLLIFLFIKPTLLYLIVHKIILLYSQNFYIYLDSHNISLNINFYLLIWKKYFI